MATVDLVMPKMGESIMEATILKWHKQPGDAVKMDETVLDIATDKVDTEVPSTAAGVVEELLYSVNDVVPVGKVIARIRTGESGEHRNNDQGARNDHGTQGGGQGASDAGKGTTNYEVRQTLGDQTTNYK